jgi:dihydrofolate reductase
MRRIVMFNWVTADGYFAGPDGNLEWVVPDDEQAKAAAEGIPRFDTVLFGRVMYELFEGFWRHAVEDAATAPDPHRPGQRSREHRAIAVWLNETTKLVFSRTPEGRYVEEFPPPPRTRPARSRGHETTRGPTHCSQRGE